MPIRYFDPSEPPLQQQYAAQMRYRGYQDLTTPEYAASVTRMFNRNPTLRPGTGLSLARANVDPDGPLAQAAVKQEARRRTEQGFGWHSIGDVVSGAFGKASAAVGAVGGTVGDVVKGVSRGADIGLTSVGQTFHGAFRESVSDGDIQGSEWLLGLPNLRKGFAQSDLAAADREVRREGGYLGLVNGKTDVDYGSGFFAGGDVAADAVQRRRKAAPLIDGHAATIGRYTASQVFEPGSKPYGLASGLVDLTIALGSDPTNWLGGGSQGAKGLARVSDQIGSGGVRAATTRGRTFTGSTGDVVRETPIALSPAAQMAKAFGEEQVTAGEFLDSALRFGSDNPSVQSVANSVVGGDLSRADAADRLKDLRSRIAVEVGLVDGLRKTVLSDVANDWLTMNDAGRRTVSAIAGTGSVAKLRREMKSVDVETLRALSMARDDNEVISVLGPKLGAQIRQRPTISRAGAKALAGEDGFAVSVKRARASSRWAAMTPHSMVDLDDLDDAVDQIDRLGAAVKMPLGVRDEFVDRMAFTNNRNERLKLTIEMMDRVQADVLGPVVSDPIRRKALTRLYGAFDDYDQFRTYALNELGRPMAVPGAPVVRAGDETLALPTPHLLAEHVGQYMPLPDLQELGRATSKVWQTLDKVGARRPSDALIAGLNEVNKVFKAGALARLAYPIRVIGEEQARMAASGLHSAYAHPLSYIALALGRAGGKDALDDPFEASTALGDALSVGSAGLFGESGKVRAPGKFAVDRADPDFARALVDNLSEFHNDALAKRIARGGLLDGDATPNPLPGVDGIKDWFFNGAGRSQRMLLSTGADAKGAPAKRSDIFTTKYNPDDALNSADGYVDSLVDRLKVATNSDPRLLEAVASGTIDGVPLMRQVAPKVFKPNPDAVRRVEALLTEGPDIGPAFAKGDVFLNPKTQDPSFAAVGRTYDSAVEKMFDVLMSKPTNFLSRAPAFKQFYWQRQTELIGFMQPDVQQAALDVARRSGLPKPVVAKLQAGAKRRSGELTASEADQLSKAFGVDSTRKLLYDLHDRNNFFEAARIVFPFGNAWAEVGKTWARIGLQENPVALRRGQQIITGLRNADTEGDGEGLFFTDENGEEVYAIPFSGWITEQVTKGSDGEPGVPMQLNGSVAGLNVFGSSVLPGLGPVITAPLAKVLPQRPQFQDIRAMLFPFGPKEYDDGALGGFAGSLMPTWLQKITESVTADPDKDRRFMNQVAFSARYLLSTGEYSLATAEGKDKLEQDSIKAARNLHALRGLAQIWTPSAPSPEYVALDRNGDGVKQVRLVEEYQKLLTEDYKTATQRFVDKFGMDAVLSIVGRTSGGGPSTTKARSFAQSNPEVVRTYRDVYGYFLPRGGKFDYEFYKSQIASGEREVITPKQSLEIANQRLGQMVYSQYKAKVGPRPDAEQRAWLSKAREAVETQYPGFNTTPANLRDRKLLITQLVEAAGDPVLSRTEAGEGLAVYLEYRQQAQAAAEQRGLTSFASAKSAADLRAFLRNAAGEVEARYPAFGEMFEQTFDREMVSEDG